MKVTRTHYEVLGLTRNATASQIKLRYRELVRKHHPDVAKDKATSHRLFLQINDAYEVLRDPVRRKAYDESLTLDEVLKARRAERSRATTAKTTDQKRSVRPPHAPRNIAQLLKDARFAFIQKRLTAASDLCREALRIDPRNARAFAILGDVRRAQGNIDSAIKYYNYAIQFDPADHDTQQKLVKLVSRHISAHSKVQRLRSSAEIRVANAIWWSIVFLLIMLIKVYPGVPIPWLHTYIPQVSKWSWNVVGFLAAASALAGAILSANGFLRHPDNELVFENAGGNWAVVPVGLLLLIGSGFFFWGAAAFYIIVGGLQGSASRSVLSVFGAVTALVLLASFMCEPVLGAQVLLFGGNIAFLSSLFGWYTGAALKPLSAE
ncbi:MAG: DnaJ domain-containing protein [Armatimonadetes bacterium]|jgi:curved DNA-binding protein CbpA|nr:DnaJ domain-containing protein [Armatimonadota bacterium]